MTRTTESITSAVSMVELLSGGGLTIETADGRTTCAQLTDSGRHAANALAGYAPGASVLISVADPIRAMEIALAAWWCGMRVAFARTDLPLGLDQQARAVDAAVHVAGPSSAGDMFRLQAHAYR